MVVVGKSNIVGLPLALLLMHREATVTVCHINTEDLEKLGAKNKKAIKKNKNLNLENLKNK